MNAAPLARLWPACAPLLGLLIAAMLGALSSCAPRGGDGEEDPDSFRAVKDIHGGPHTDMMLVYLLTGPNSAGHSKERKAELFAGHMANMKRLSEARQLLVAGPFATPRNSAWRGIFVVDTPSTMLARQLVATDPAVAAGEFEPLAVPVKAHISLRLALEREAALRRRLGLGAPEASGSPSAGSPPPAATIRAYCMLTAADAPAADAAAALLAQRGMEQKIVLALRITGGPQRGGCVWIIDAKSPADLLAALCPEPGGAGAAGAHAAGAGAAGAGAAGADAPRAEGAQAVGAGACLPPGVGIDRWWSSAALVEIDPAARTLPRAD